MTLITILASLLVIYGDFKYREIHRILIPILIVSLFYGQIGTILLLLVIYSFLDEDESCDYLFITMCALKILDSIQYNSYPFMIYLFFIVTTIGFILIRKEQFKKTGVPLAGIISILFIIMEVIKWNIFNLL